jgi:F0F1-type ATP synthase delta subunit
MTKNPIAYAEALVWSLKDASEKEQQVRIQRFHKLLKKQGDVRLLSPILREFEKLWEQKNGKVARLVSTGTISSFLKESIESGLKEKGYQLREVKEESLIGGAAVFLGNEYLIDNSIQGKLRKLQMILK